MRQTGLVSAWFADPQLSRISLLILLALVIGSPWKHSVAVTLAGNVAQGNVAQGDADDLVKLILTLLQDKDPDVRALAFEQIRSQAKGKQATERFASELPRLPSEVQVGLLRALSQRGDDAARSAVLRLLSASDQPPVRVAAVQALGSLGNADDIPQLVGFLGGSSDLDGGSEPTRKEQSAARASLVRLQGEQVGQRIASQMKHASPKVRVQLIQILTTRRALETIPQLLSAAVDAPQEVRRAAMVALGQLAEPEHLPGMVQGVLKAEAGSERAAAEKAVMFVCNRIADAQQRAEPLLAALEPLGQQNRLTMLSTVGRVGGPQAQKLVEAAIANPDPDIHQLGLRAICNWPHASIAPRLIELAKTEKQPELQVMALRALMRVAPLPDKRPASEKLALLKQATAMAVRDKEIFLALDRARAIRTVETLRFVLPYLNQPRYAEQACYAVVELAHHRGLREPNKAEFDRALDKVIQTSQDPTTIDRAKRYKKGQTWVRPTARGR